MGNRPTQGPGFGASAEIAVTVKKNPGQAGCRRGPACRCGSDNRPSPDQDLNPSAEHHHSDLELVSGNTTGSRLVSLTRRAWKFFSV